MDTTDPEAVTNPAEAVSGSRALPRGASVGRYLIVQHIGGGGMGLVYLAYDPELDRRVALKLLRPEMAAAAADHVSRPEARLLREAQALARVAHPNVIAVYDVGIHASSVFVAMEHVPGQTLRRYLAERPRPVRDILEAFVQAGRGLAAAHRAGLVHRDFKPDNVLCGTDGRVRVLDFGLARAAGMSGRDDTPLSPALAASLATPATPATPTLPLTPTPADLASGPGSPVVSPEQALAAIAGAPASVGGSSSASGGGPLSPVLATPLTRTGAILGTPAYMAPEQLFGLADGRTDQYSFCVALYEAVLGHRPTRNDTLPDTVLERIGGSQPARATTSATRRAPGWLLKVLDRGLSAEPSARYPTMEALLADLVQKPRRRRLLGAAAGALVLVGLVGMGVLRLGRARARMCADAGQGLASLWDDARKATVHAAFARTGKPFAEDVYRTVARRVDAYVRDWAAMQSEACVATRIRHVQSEELLDLRTSCLDDRRAALRAQVELWSAADGRGVERAASAVESLPPLDSCANATSLRAPLAPPADPAARARIAKLRADVARARVLFVGDRYAEAGPAAKAAAESARAMDYPPVQAEALCLLAEVQERAGQKRDAEKTLEDALIAAEAGRHDEIAAKTWIDTVAWASGDKKTQLGYTAARHARAILDRMGGNSFLDGALDLHLGYVLSIDGRLDDAVAAYQRAIGHLEKAGRSDGVALAHMNLADALRQKGRLDEALASVRRALALEQGVQGPAHPRLSWALEAESLVLQDQGKLDESIAVLRRSIALLEGALGKSHPGLSQPLRNLAELVRRQGHLQEPLALYERARTLSENALGPEDPAVADSEEATGFVLNQLGRGADAARHLRRAIAIDEKQLGPDKPEVTYPMVSLGEALAQQGRAVEALAVVRRALAVRQKALGPKDASVASAQAVLGEIELGRAGVAAARGWAARAVETAQASKDDITLARAYLLEGRIALAGRDPARALLPLERAVDLRERAPADALDLAQARFALARALQAAGRERGRALELAQKARAACGDATARVAEIDAWLAKRPR